MTQTSTPAPAPYIAASTVLPELSIRSLLVGTLLGMVFGASSLYLVLKVGLTVSASIPVAVISITLFKLLSKMRERDAAAIALIVLALILLLIASTLGFHFGRNLFNVSLFGNVFNVNVAAVVTIFIAIAAIAVYKLLPTRSLGLSNTSILENNISQTAGSAGESIAFGLGVTMPAIMILGFDLEIVRVMLVAVLGGLLGILMMIPLRRALIVQQHGVLKFPEGTACAEVLKAGASDESRAAASPEAKADEAKSAAPGINGATIFTGLGIGLLYKTLNVALKGWRDVPEKIFGAPFKGGSIAAEISPELLGVGYIIGPRIAAIMCAGGVLAYLVLIPMIKFFGEGMIGPLAPGTMPISEMGPNQIRGAYVLYIGAGAVAAGGIISLVRSLPLIWHGMRASFGDVGFAQGSLVLRTDRDMPMKVVFIGLAALIVVIMLAKPLHMNLLGALMIIVFGFLFVAVSSRLTGEVGSSSNPISGMTVATLLLTCLIFLLVGWTGGVWYVTALSVGGIVCIASSNGGTTSQDLKTGFLVGATPKLQQISILIGSLASALILGPILLLLNGTAMVYVPVAQVAPAGLTVDVNTLSTKLESLSGPQARDDQRQYRVWQKTSIENGPAGKYFVNDAGQAVYLVDPGINGTFNKRPDGTEVRKFDAPKATLMSYIIKGVLDHHLPWELVLLGAMIAICLEMASIPSLPFAVGVYLPLSSSSPIFFGGLIRWLVDLRLRKKLASQNLSEERFQAEADRSPGVLLASGYIAGGAIGGIIIAVLAGAFDQLDAALNDWSKANNPFFEGPYADALSMIPFVVMMVFLWLVGNGKLLAGGTRRP
jgi:putative OPT family oligopeptide transporter